MLGGGEGKYNFILVRGALPYIKWIKLIQVPGTATYHQKKLYWKYMFLRMFSYSTISRLQSYVGFVNNLQCRKVREVAR